MTQSGSEKPEEILREILRTAVTSDQLVSEFLDELLQNGEVYSGTSPRPVRTKIDRGIQPEKANWQAGGDRCD